MCFVFWIHPNKINLTHNGIDRVSASVRCLVLVKMCGNSPTKLFTRIIRDIEVRMNVCP